jgi:hypothetical protein
VLIYYPSIPALFSINDEIFASLRLSVDRKMGMQQPDRERQCLYSLAKSANPFKSATTSW